MTRNGNERQAEQFLRSRRSVRFFKEETPKTDILRRLIEIARFAPTAGNVQMLEWRVLTDRDRIKAIAAMTVDWMRGLLEKSPRAAPPYLPMIVAAWDMGFDAVLRDAPALVAASAPEEDDNGMVDVALALSYFELAAPKFGLGTCWAGIVEWALQSSAEIREALGIPESHPHHYPMMVGHPKVKYHRLPERKPPKIRWN
jgi:nitroreductase